MALARCGIVGVTRPNVTLGEIFGAGRARISNYSTGWDVLRE